MKNFKPEKECLKFYLIHTLLIGLIGVECLENHKYWKSADWSPKGS